MESDGGKEENTRRVEIEEGRNKHQKVLSFPKDFDNPKKGKEGWALPRLKPYTKFAFNHHHTTTTNHPNLSDTCRHAGKPNFQYASLFSLN